MFTASGGREARTGESTQVLWRLVAGNNHGLGRAANPCPDVQHCLAEVELLRRRLDSVEAVVLQSGAGSGWTWQVRLDDRLVAVSSRSYQRQREGRYNLDQFLAAILLTGASGGLAVAPRQRSVRRNNTAGTGRPRSVTGQGAR